MRVLVALALILNITWADEQIVCFSGKGDSKSKVTCPATDKVCYSSTGKDGVIEYGCGFCSDPTSVGNECEQCLGNTDTPCNTETYQAGASCYVANKAKDGLTTVDCPTDTVLCYSPLSAYTGSGPKDWPKYGCGICPETAEENNCIQCEGTACNRAYDPKVKPENEIYCDVTIKDSKNIPARCGTPENQLYCHSEKDANGNKVSGCGLCPSTVNNYEAEKAQGCEQCVGSNDAAACNREGYSGGVLCEVTWYPPTVLPPPFTPVTCMEGVTTCYSETDTNGYKIYGCGLCPNGAGPDCEQCEGNDKTPCNKEDSPKGVICNVNFGSNGEVIPVACKQGVEFCNTKNSLWPLWTYTYGCGECPPLVFGRSCIPCEGNDAQPCNRIIKSEMPKKIDNGEMVEEMENDDPDMAVNMAKYKCNEDYMMMETWKGDMGWSRHDGTYELPRCVTKDEWFKMEYELVSQNYRMKDAGRVKARYHYADDKKGDWFARCDDHMNNPAAGAVCRDMGFRYGRQIQPDRRMKPIENIPFGKTNTYCYHDDTLLTSESCNVDDYDEMARQGWPLCVPDEQAAVHCFNDWWKVDVGFKMVERSGKMFCPVQVIKEGNEMKMKRMKVKWGVIIIKDQDNYHAEYLEEVTDYQTIGGFSKKKGFRAKLIGDKSDYDCYFCDVRMDGHVMDHTSDTNHNCGADFNAIITRSGCSIGRKAECNEKAGSSCKTTCTIFGIKSEKCKSCFGDLLYEECKCCLHIFCKLCPTCRG